MTMLTFLKVLSIAWLVLFIVWTVRYGLAVRARNEDYRKTGRRRKL